MLMTTTATAFMLAAPSTCRSTTLLLLVAAAVSLRKARLLASARLNCATSTQSSNAPLVLALFSQSQVVIVAALVVWGIAFGGLPAMLQTRMLHTASARLRDLAAALFTTSFNFAIGFGALVGGLLLDQIGIITLPFVDVVIISVGVVFMLGSNVWLAARAKRSRIA